NGREARVEPGHHGADPTAAAAAQQADFLGVDFRPRLEVVDAAPLVNDALHHHVARLVGQEPFFLDVRVQHALPEPIVVDYQHAAAGTHQHVEPVLYPIFVLAPEAVGAVHQQDGGEALALLHYGMSKVPGHALVVGAAVSDLLNHVGI